MSSFWYPSNNGKNVDNRSSRMVYESVCRWTRMKRNFEMKHDWKSATKLAEMINRELDERPEAALPAYNTMRM